MSANDDLQDAAISHAVDLRAYTDSAVRQMLAVLQRSDVRLEADLRAALGRISPDTFTVARIEAQLATVRATLAGAYERLTDQLQLELQDFAGFEASWQANTMQTALPAVVNIATVTPAAVYAAAVARPFQGALLREWMAEQSSTAATRIRRAVAQGFAESKTNDQIVREIIGTKAKGYRDGILEISRREASAVVRTAVNHTAAVAAEQFEAANADILKAVKWLATLDTRTSPPCRVRDQKLYAVGSHKPIGHALPWGAGPGQFHWSCRSTRTLVTKGWEQLGIPAFDAVERESMDGQVPASLDYGDWLRKQSATRQDEVLGPERGKLFRDGSLTLADLYTR